jgi:hypothetical protein
VTDAHGKPAFQKGKMEFKVDKLCIKYTSDGVEDPDDLLQQQQVEYDTVTYTVHPGSHTFDLGQWQVPMQRNNNNNTAPRNEAVQLQLVGLKLKRVGGNDNDWIPVICAPLSIQLLHHTQTVYKIRSVRVYSATAPEQVADDDHSNSDDDDDDDDDDDIPVIPIAGPNQVVQFGALWTLIPTTAMPRPDTGDYLLQLIVHSSTEDRVTGVTIGDVSAEWPKSKSNQHRWDSDVGCIWVVLPAAACSYAKECAGDKYTVNIQVHIQHTLLLLQVVADCYTALDAPLYCMCFVRYNQVQLQQKTPYLLQPKGLSYAVSIGAGVPTKLHLQPRLCSVNNTDDDLTLPEVEVCLQDSNGRAAHIDDDASWTVTATLQPHNYSENSSVALLPDLMTEYQYDASDKSIIYSDLRFEDPVEVIFSLKLVPG